MIEYDYNNIKAYPLLHTFKVNNKDLFYDRYPDVEEHYMKFFLNYLNRLKDIYMKLQQQEIELIGIKFYEGVIKAIYYVMDHPAYIPGNGIKDNKAFNFDYLIERCESQLAGLLHRANSEFDNDYKTTGAYFLGVYKMNKELIKIYRLFMGVRHEKRSI